MKNLLLVCLLALTANLMAERCACSRPRPKPAPAPAPVPAPKPALCDPNIQDCTGKKGEVELLEQDQELVVCDPATQICEEKREVEQEAAVVAAPEVVEVIEVLDAVVAHLEAKEECIPGGLVECRRALAEGEEMVCCSDMVAAMSVMMEAMAEEKMERSPRHENEPFIAGPDCCGVSTVIANLQEVNQSLTQQINNLQIQINNLQIQIDQCCG